MATTRPFLRYQTVMTPDGKGHVTGYEKDGRVIVCLHLGAVGANTFKKYAADVLTAAK